jgi:uncharacterized protein (TIGR02246 family)
MTKENSRAADEAEIRTLIDHWAKALRAKDADGVVSHYGDNVMFVLAPPLQVSGEADAKNLKAWFSTWQGPIGYDIRDLNIIAGNNVAFCHSLNRMSGTKTDGGNVDMWFRETLGLRKIGGKWMITHEHSSVPFYMDGTFKAAVDLKPLLEQENTNAA